MKGPKRTSIKREADYLRIAEMYKNGHSQIAIARELGLSQGQVSLDIAEVKRRWRAESVEFIDDAKQEELRKIDNLEMTYWESWERSLKDAVTVIVETESVAAKMPDADDIVLPTTKTKESKKRSGQSGNPAFLSGVMSCIDRRCKLLGLDAPTESKVTGKIEHDYRGELLRKLADLSKPGRTIFGEIGGESTARGASADPELAGTD